LPKFSRANWKSEFKSAFKDLALNYGEAGSIIIKEVDIVRKQPIYEETKSIIDPNAEGGRRRVRTYPEDAIGWRRFERDERKYEKLEENKMKLMNKLFDAMDKEIRDKMTQALGYQFAYDNCDLLALWRIAEQICLGRGSVSISQLILRIMKMKQTGSYTSFCREFKDAVVDLKRQVVDENYEDLLNSIIDAWFITSVNQEQFKDKLKDIYCERIWPSYTELSVMLQDYAENVEKVQALRNNQDEGIIKANVAKPSKVSYNCWNFGSIPN
jgi:hypothetical protein